MRKKTYTKLKSHRKPGNFNITMRVQSKQNKLVLIAGCVLG